MAMTILFWVLCGATVGALLSHIGVIAGAIFGGALGFIHHSFQQQSKKIDRLEQLLKQSSESKQTERLERRILQFLSEQFAVRQKNQGQEKSLQTEKTEKEPTFVSEPFPSLDPIANVSPVSAAVPETDVMPEQPAQAISATSPAAPTVAPSAAAPVSDMPLRRHSEPLTQQEEYLLDFDLDLPKRSQKSGDATREKTTPAHSGKPFEAPSALPHAATGSSQEARQPFAQPFSADMQRPPSSGPGISAQRDEDDLDNLFTRAKNWLLGGNTLVRVGLLVLFCGLAFLARYAVEHTLLSPQMRLAGISLLGGVLTVIGWRLRISRPGYGLSLQGGGIAILYLTVFAALRLYTLMPPGMAFLLMLVLVGLTVAFAVLQNAAVLAIIATAGGFAAPILTSTGGGNHVQLFGYYALLNTGILILAWRKAWRGLNLTGFLFTFAIGAIWGLYSYQPRHFASTEFFLILFCVMYVAAAVAYAWRQAPSLRDPVDGTLVFGVPVIASGLQAVLVIDMPYGLAWSAFGAGVFYLTLGRLLRRLGKSELSLLAECFVVLGIAFLTAAIPLAFDGHWSAAAWALEGAALWWLGIRQERDITAWTGLLLQLGAGFMFVVDVPQYLELRDTPVFNGILFGSVMIALAGFISAWIAEQRLKNSEWALLRFVLLAWAVLWWLWGGSSEISAQLPPMERVSALLLFNALSGLIAVVVGMRLQWRSLLYLGLLPAAGMMLATLQAFAAGMPPSAHGGWMAWPATLLIHLYCLRRMENRDVGKPLLTLAHIAGMWILALTLSREAGLRVSHMAVGDGWKYAAFALPPALLLTLLTYLGRKPLWPFSSWRRAYFLEGGIPIAVALGIWSLLIFTYGSGGAEPFAYVPVLNPLDIALIVVLGTLVYWLHNGQRDFIESAELCTQLWGLLAITAFVTANASLLRAVHHLADIPWSVRALMRQSVTQASLSLFWSLLGLILMLLANRSKSRTIWFAGMSLMAIVVGKLFLIDLAASGTLARIVAFIGAGLLLLVVGYFSPLPPQQKTSESEDDAGERKSAPPVG